MVIELVVSSDNSEAVLDIDVVVVDILGICDVVGVIVDSVAILVDIVDSVGNCSQVLEINEVH